MSSLRNAIAAAVLVAATPAAAEYGIGAPATEAEIAAWDIDIRPDGQGLPPGRGSVAEGEEVYDLQCSACHGVFGYGEGRYPPLVGGEPRDIAEELRRGGRPEKTVGSYWPYATTLFDYVRRAMPFGNAQSLSPDETYAVVAYLLNMNGIVPDDAVLDAETLPKVEMPNVAGFIDDPRPDAHNTACMENCRPEGEKPQIASVAADLDVTPESDQEALRE